MSTDIKIFIISSQYQLELKFFFVAYYKIYWYKNQSVHVFVKCLRWFLESYRCPKSITKYKVMTNKLLLIADAVAAAG